MLGFRDYFFCWLLVCLVACWLVRCWCALLVCLPLRGLCSTSPPGGNQVDGLPPDAHTGSVVLDVPVQPRRFITFDDGNVHNFLSADSLLVLLHSKLLNYI